MKQSSTLFEYHGRTYDLTKWSQADHVKWILFWGSPEHANVKVLEFTDENLSYHQAEHMAKHMLRLYNQGKADGAQEIRTELQRLING